VKRACVFCAVFLAGCAVPPETDLDGKPAARLRVASTHSYAARAAIVAGECIPVLGVGTSRLATLPPRGDRPKRDSIGMPMSDFPEYAHFSEHRIPAGAPLRVAFSVNYGVGLSFNPGIAGGCARGVRFTPEEGADYEARFAEEGSRCTLVLRKLVPAEGGKALPASAGGVPMSGC
jgi:hypothetical protein